MYDWSSSIGLPGDSAPQQPRNPLDVLDLETPVPASTATTGFCLSADAQPYDGLAWDAPFVFKRPMHRILKGDLQSLWIDPIVRKLESLGARLELGRRLVGVEIQNSRVVRARFADVDGGESIRPIERLILAIPVEKVAELLDDHFYAAAPALGELRHVRTRAMASFDVQFKRRIGGMPDAHVNLLDSRYGTSFIDVAQTWPGLDRTTLNLIASDVTDLEDLSPQLAVAALMEDLRRYLPPFGPADVERIVFQSHRDQPLFMNDVGAWAFRPDARTQVGNLYLAGDYCRSHVDLVSMEGAITTGLRAADEADPRGRHHGRPHELADSLEDDLELTIILPLQGGELLGEIGVLLEHPA